MRTARRIRVGDLVGSRVVTSTGTTLGRVSEVLATRQPPHRVTTLELGPYGWLDRLNVSTWGLIGRRADPHGVRWEAVDRFEHGTIILKPGHDQDVSRL